MSKDRFTASSYHRMSAAEKQASSLAAVRELPRACPRCGTQVPSAELLVHFLQRCQGPRDPGPASKWITWGEATALGVSDATFKRWVDRGLVRFKGEPPDRKYLEGDLSFVIVLVMLLRRRDFQKRKRG